MRRTKRFAGFALAACMGVSLLVNVPAGTVSAAELGIGWCHEWNKRAGEASGGNPDRTCTEGRRSTSE